MSKGNSSAEGFDVVSFAKDPSNYLCLLFDNVERKVKSLVKSPERTWESFGCKIQNIFFTKVVIEKMIGVLLENKCISICNSKKAEKFLDEWDKKFFSIDSLAPALVSCVETKTIPHKSRYMFKSLVEVAYYHLNMEGIEKIAFGIGDDENKIHDSYLENEKILHKFFNNLHQDSINSFIIIPSLKDLNEFNKGLLSEAKKTSKEFNLKEKYALRLTEYNVLRILQNSSNRNLRKEAFLKRNVLANSGEFNNSSLVKQILFNNCSDAKNSGYTSVVRQILKDNNLVLSEVSKFFKTTEAKLFGEYIKIQEKLDAFAKENLGINVVRAWDFDFVLNQYHYMLLKKNHIGDISFKSDVLWEKIYKKISDVFSLKLVEDKQSPKIYVNDKIVNVFNNNILIGSIYVNTDTRPGRCTLDYSIPVSDSCFLNESNPIKIFISLSLSVGAKFTDIGEVTTTFHEFGHAIQVILAQYYTDYKKSLSGDVKFLSGIEAALCEFPSQWLEEQSLESDFLNGVIYSEKILMDDEKINNYLNIKKNFDYINDWINFVSAKVDWVINKNGNLKKDEILMRANNVYRMMGLYCPKNKNILNTFTHLHMKGAYFVYPFTKNVVNVFNNFYSHLTLQEKGLHLKTIYMNGCQDGLMKYLRSEKGMNIFVCK